MEWSSDAILHIATARLLISSDQFIEADASLVAAAEFVSESSAFAAELEELWDRFRIRNGDYDLAIESFMRAAGLDPARPENMLELAGLYALSQEWDEAALWMQSAIQTAPYRVADYWELLGECLIDGGREAEAISAFEVALDIEPYRYLARLRLAEAMERNGQSGTAIELLEFLSDLSIDWNVEVYTRLADLYTSAGRDSDARKSLDKGARLIPDSAEIDEQRQLLGI